MLTGDIWYGVKRWKVTWELRWRETVQCQGHCEMFRDKWGLDIRGDV